MQTDEYIGWVCGSGRAGCPKSVLSGAPHLCGAQRGELLAQAALLEKIRGGDLRDGREELGGVRLEGLGGVLSDGARRAAAWWRGCACQRKAWVGV